MTTSKAIPRSQAIPKSWATLDIPSLFSAFIYPVLGIIALAVSIVVGLAFEGVTLKWWYALVSAGVVAFTIFICNLGIGPLHRILQHKAGELKPPAQVFVMLNCVIAMQGRLTDWINYHSQHHRFSDKPGDPHNPFESKFWAWVGWILWRDPKDLERPAPRWIKDNKVIMFGDRAYSMLSIIIHFLIPGAIYLIVWAAGGSLILTLMLHGSAIIGRAVQFHATTLGINVFGHLKTPKWADHLLALLTGGEAFHDHHHDEPVSILHRPRKGVWNRIVDYNGTVLLLLEKLKLARNLKVAPQFA